MHQDNFETPSQAMVGFMIMNLIVSTVIQIVWIWIFVSVGIPSILKAVEIVGTYWGH